MYLTGELLVFHVPEKYRVTNGGLASDASCGNNGLFIIGKLRVVASNEEGWEHVSISLKYRTPNWREMCEIKNLFWGSEDCVIQYHPPQKVYINTHSNVLHLWRKIGSEFETPPMILV